MKVKLSVEKSTLSSNGGYVNTLRGVLVTTRLGVAKTTKLRFLMKTDAEPVAGVEEEFDLAEFTQHESEFTAPDGNVIKSIWLREKVA